MAKIGKLTSGGSGRKVTSHRQAIAIGPEPAATDDDEDLGSVAGEEDPGAALDAPEPTPPTPPVRRAPDDKKP